VHVIRTTRSFMRLWLPSLFAPRWGLLPAAEFAPLRHRPRGFLSGNRGPASPNGETRAATGWSGDH
jgi:hypothetical protein